MSSDQFVVLAALEQCGEMTQQELVRCCFSDTATMGAMLALLRRKKLLTRVEHPEDGRAWAVQLTAAGRKLTAEMRLNSDDVRRDLASLFKPSEAVLLLEFLNRIAESMRPSRRRSASKKARASRTRAAVRPISREPYKPIRNRK